LPVDQVHKAALDLDDRDPMLGPQDDDVGLPVAGPIGEPLIDEDDSVVG